MKKSLVIIIGLLAAVYLPMVFPWVCLGNDIPGVLDIPGCWVHYLAQMVSIVPIMTQLAFLAMLVASTVWWVRRPAKKSFVAMLGTAYLTSPAGITLMAAIAHM